MEVPAEDKEVSTTDHKEESPADYNLYVCTLLARQLDSHAANTHRASEKKYCEKVIYNEDSEEKDALPEKEDTTSTATPEVIAAPASRDNTSTNKKKRKYLLVPTMALKPVVGKYLLLPTVVGELLLDGRAKWRALAAYNKFFL